MNRPPSPTLGTRTFSRKASLAICAVAYLLAFVAGWLTVAFAPIDDPLWKAFAADCVATVAVFGFSVAFDNSSMYDAYWSVAPPVIGAYFLTLAPAGADPLRQALCLGLCAAWGMRLTYNWARGWPGLHHEDWRYVEMREKSGKLYWPASLLGIHFYPTVEVYLACLAMWPALTAAGRPFGVLDVVATVVTAGAVIIEAVADRQLRNFVSTKESGEVMNRGLWRFSRHPNYFGEMAFWWGLFLYGYSASPEDWTWTIIGPAAISVMFFTISIPWMERRQLERRPAFAKQIETTSMLIPWFPKR